jgi:signal transduction histidine kinase
VVNLVNNAIHHCPAGSVVSVGVRVDKLGRAAISVRDNGPGIAPEHQLRVFRRFDRGGAALRVSGRGLGLSNALAIARAHGGSIDLTSTPGQGARFTLRLPLAAVVEPRDTPLDSRLRLSA